MTEILVGLDNSDQSRDALAFARMLADATRASLRLASAFPYSEPPGRGANAAFREYLRRDTQALLDRARASLADDADVPTHAIADVSPARALHRLAENTGAALLVVGSTHRGRFGRVMPGSTGERLLHGSPCAVAIVPHLRPDTGGSVDVVGVGYDGSEDSKSALHGAHALAKNLDATLRVIHAFDASDYTSPALMSGFGWAAVGADLRDEARADLERLVAELDGEAPVEAAFVTGAPARVLIDQAKHLDLLVLGSRGYGPAHAVLLGGVSHAVVCGAGCPVVVQPRGAGRGLEQLVSRTETRTADARAAS